MGFYGLIVITAIIIAVLMVRAGLQGYPQEYEVVQQINMYKGIVGVESFWTAFNLSGNVSNYNLTDIGVIDGVVFNQSHGIPMISSGFIPSVHES